MKRLNLIVVTILSLILLLSYTQSLPISNASDVSKIQSIPSIENPTPQIFRLLAIEAGFSGYPMKSAQYLISALLQFQNWDNSSTEYISYIHLLSLFNSSEIFDDVKKFYRGSTTKVNMYDEIVNFLGAATPGEVVILYILGDGGDKLLLLDELITDAELTSWLASGGLPEANVCIILDACYTGSWIDDGEEPGGVLGPGRVVLCSSRSDQLSWSFGDPLSYTWFTGRENAEYDIHLGIIGGLFGANDTNGDGWISMMENFAFAKISTEEYSFGINPEKLQNPVAYNGLGFDPPFVLLPEAIHDVAIKNIKPTRTILGNSTSTSINVTVQNQGDTLETFNLTVYANTTLIEIKEITLPSGNSTTITFTWNTTDFAKGNYTISAEADTVPSETDTEDNTLIYGTVIVTILGDLNGDGEVKIKDIAMAAKAFGSKPGDENWEPNADINEDGEIKIFDVATVAKEFGKTV